MDTKKLRQKILDLAIHGKLVPQDPNDEPASVLLERIKVEKERLIKEGKIKRSKKSGSSDTLHYPYLLPKGWKWCKLEDIICELKYGTSEKSSSVGKIAVLRMGNITNVGTIDYSNLVYSSNDEDIKQYSLEKDDLLFNRTNSSEWVGKTAIYKEEQPAIYAGYLIRVRPLLISADYLNIVMNSSYYRNWCYNVKTDAVNQSNINAQKLSQLMIPIPPLEEQEKIVVEMAKWISLIGTIKNGKDDLQSIVKQAKNKILDLAIHGKLIPQDPNDEPAIELLKRINPDFTPCDNGHYAKLVQFEVPKSWMWTTINKISTSILYGVSESAKSKGRYKLLRITDIQDNYVCWQSVPFIDYDENKVKQYLLQNGDIVFARTGATVGKSYLIENLSEQVIYASYLIRVRTYSLILPQYVKYFFKSGYYWNQIEQNSFGVGQPNVNATILGNLNIPIPPIEEQKRIVKAIEQLLKQINKIMENL